MEALIGAIYLDAGLEPVMELARRELDDALAVPAERDAKTLFQERVMARHGEFPRYALVRDSGVEGDEARFTVSALVRGEELARGIGRSKRAAEFEAARGALGRLDGSDGRE